MLIKKRKTVLSTSGIPFSLVYSLLKGSSSVRNCFHDANLKNHFGEDDDLKEINRLEKRIGDLSSDQLDLRVIADLCCIWRYDFPENVHRICEAIGGGADRTFRLHYQVSTQRRRRFIQYGNAIKGWLEDIAPDDKMFSEEGARQTATHVYGLLGEKNPLKSILAERTYLGLSDRRLNCSFWGRCPGKKVSLHPYGAQELPSGWEQRMRQLERQISKEMGGGAYDFLCDVGGSAEPACHFKFLRRVDILLSSIGCLRWRGNLPPKDSSVTGRRKLTGHYLNLLERYWRDGKQEGDGAEIFQTLGQPDDFKRWLVASLWKNIKNQTRYQAYPMKRWMEFVRIGEDYLDRLS